MSSTRYMADFPSNVGTDRTAYFRAWRAANPDKIAEYRVRNREWMRAWRNSPEGRRAALLNSKQALVRAAAGGAR